MSRLAVKIYAADFYVRPDRDCEISNSHFLHSSSAPNFPDRPSSVKTQLRVVIGGLWRTCWKWPQSSSARQSPSSSLSKPIIFCFIKDRLNARLEFYSSRKYAALVRRRGDGFHHKKIERAISQHTPEAITSGTSCLKWAASAASIVADKIQS